MSVEALNRPKNDNEADAEDGDKIPPRKPPEQLSGAPTNPDKSPKPDIYPHEPELPPLKPRLEAQFETDDSIGALEQHVKSIVEAGQAGAPPKQPPGGTPKDRPERPEEPESKKSVPKVEVATPAHDDKSTQEWRDAFGPMTAQVDGVVHSAEVNPPPGWLDTGKTPEKGQEAVNAPVEFLHDQHLQELGISPERKEIIKRYAALHPVTDRATAQNILDASLLHIQATPEQRQSMEAQLAAAEQVRALAKGGVAAPARAENVPKPAPKVETVATAAAPEVTPPAAWEVELGVPIPEKPIEAASIPEAKAEGVVTQEQQKKLNPENIKKFGEGRTEAIAQEAKEKGLSQRAIETIEKVGEWYKKQPAWKKIAFSSALFATTVAGATIGGGVIGSTLLAAGLTGSTLNRGLASASAFVMGKKASLWLKPEANKDKPERVFDRHTLTGLSAAVLVFAMPTIMRQTEVGEVVAGAVREKLSIAGKWMMANTNIEALTAGAYEADVTGLPNFNSAPPVPVDLHEGISNELSKVPMPDGGEMPDFAAAADVTEMGAAAEVPPIGTLDGLNPVSDPWEVADVQPTTHDLAAKAMQVGASTEIPDSYAKELVVPKGSNVWRAVQSSLSPLGLSPEQQQNMTGNVVEYLKAHPELNPNIKDFSKIPTDVHISLPPPDQMAAWQTHATGLTPSQVGNIHSYDQKIPTPPGAEAAPSPDVIPSPDLSAAASKELFAERYYPKKSILSFFSGDPSATWDKVSNMTAGELLTPNTHPATVGMNQLAFAKLQSDIVRITGGSAHPEFSTMLVKDVLKKGVETGAFTTNV